MPLSAPQDEILRAYFCDGLTTQIIGSLARVPDIAVIAAGTMLRYRPSCEPRALGRDLGAGYAVAGTLGRKDQRLVFDYQLWDAELGELIWTDGLETNLDDLFDAERWIVGRIVNGIVPHIREAEIRRAMLQPASSLTAYDLMLKALPLIQRLDRQSHARAAGLLESACRLDPDFGMAYAWSARLHSLTIGQGWSSNRGYDQSAAFRLAETALRCDPTNSLALATSGHLHGYLSRDYDRAITLFDSAIAACHNDVVALALSSLTLSYRGQGSQARQRAEHAIRLSPMDPFQHMHHLALALSYYVEGEYAAAEHWSRRSLAENANFTSSHKILAASLAAQGRISEARDVARDLSKLEPGFAATGAHINPLRDPLASALYVKHLRAAGAVQPERR